MKERCLVHVLTPGTMNFKLGELQIFQGAPATYQSEGTWLRDSLHHQLCNQLRLALGLQHLAKFCKQCIQAFISAFKNSSSPSLVGHNLGCYLNLCSYCNSETPSKCFCFISALLFFLTDTISSLL